MALGPFISYVPPGVYTRTLTEANASNLVAGLRIPAIIGVGQEELEQIDLEVVRGSSSTVDQQIVNEDPSLQWVVDATNPSNLQLGAQDGTLTQLQVKNYPIVDGQGFGRVTNDTRTVTVTVNGTPVSLGSVQGQQGLVNLQVPTQPTDVIRVTYFFHRGDTAFTDDVSEQVTASNATLVSPGFEAFDVVADINDTFIITVNSVTATIVLPAGSLSAASVVAVIGAATIPGLVVTTSTDGAGKVHVSFTSSQSLVIGSGNANGIFGFSTGTSTNRVDTFRVFQRPIVDGTSGGITTTDPSKVVAKVNGNQVLVSAVDGSNGLVTLPFAPSPSSTVTIEYWANTWQDTFDYLPNSLVTTVLRSGISPGRNDFIQGPDFTISNPTTDVSVINWGSAFNVAATQTTPGATPFDGIDGQGGQIVGTLIDFKMFQAPCQRVVDTTTIPATVSSRDFLLPEVPTTGNGRSTILGLTTFNSVANSRQNLTTNRPDLVRVWTGTSLADALNRPEATVLEVDGVNRRVTLKDSVNPDHSAFASFYYSTLSDDTFTLTNLVAGPVGSGEYQLSSALLGADLYETRFGTKAGLPETVQWPRGAENIPDAFHTGVGTPVSEVVTVTFGSAAATNATVTNKGAAPYSFYSPFSSTWTTKVNGVDAASSLAAASEAYLVSAKVATPAGAITIPVAPNNDLNITVDGVDIATISLTAGVTTPAAVVAEINAGIDADAAFIGTAPNALCSFAGIGAGDEGFFIIKGLEVPAVLPGGFDTTSVVTIRQGTVEGTLGFDTFQSVAGSAQAVNKPATMLSTIAGPYNITAGVNDLLLFQMNGADFSVTLTAGAAVAAATIVADIAGVPGLAAVPSAGTLGNLDQIRLTSTTNEASSRILMQNGTANAVLGFTVNNLASQTLVSAQEVANVLNDTPGFASGAVAYASDLSGSTFVTIESLTVGAATSSIAFVDSAGTSAFNPTSGTGITPGVDGDNGEDASDNFVVTSDAAAGSAGTGTPGQTYTDVATGLRFSVLPSATGSYTPAGSFTMTVTPTFHVDPSVPRYAVGGLELVVSNTVGVGINDTASLQTFNPDGIEPAVGDFYFISYRFLKQDYSARVFQQLKTIEANFGDTAPENRLTLAAFLAILNGAILIICKQVLKEPNTSQASAQSFNEAIDELATPLPGNIRPDIMVPLSTATSVYTHLTAHCETQSNIRNQAERIGFIGFASGTSPTSAQAVAQGLVSNRIVAYYPDSSVITLTDELGQSFESLVDGSFYAAAAAGAVVSPTVDVATPYTRRRIQGFTRIPRILDPVEANQTAVAGVTLLEDLDPIIRIRQGLTTNMQSILTRLPTVVQISDFVQQQSRGILDSFVGTKFLATRTNEVVVSMTSLFKTFIQAEIVSAFQGMSAEIDPDDPTILRFEMYYSPIFPLLYLVLTFNLRARI